MSNGVDMSKMRSTALLALALTDVKVILSGVGSAEFSIKKYCVKCLRARK